MSTFGVGYGVALAVAGVETGVETGVGSTVGCGVASGVTIGLGSGVGCGRGLSSPQPIMNTQRRSKGKSLRMPYMVAVMRDLFSVARIGVRYCSTAARLDAEYVEHTDILMA